MPFQSVMSTHTKGTAARGSQSVRCIILKAAPYVLESWIARFGMEPIVSLPVISKKARPEQIQGVRLAALLLVLEQAQ